MTAPAFTPAMGFGGKLEVDTAYPGTPAKVDVGHVRDFSFNPDVAEGDVTHQQSQTDGPWWKDFIPGGIAAEITFNGNFDPGKNEHENTILNQLGIVRQWTYTFKDGSVWTFVGFLRTPSMSAPCESPLSQDVTIRVTGKPSFAGSEVAP